MTDPHVVLKKLMMLREHASRIRARRPATAAEFGADVVQQDAIALNFLVAAQEAGDIAMHIASDEGWGLPSSYREAFEILANHGVIALDHASELATVIFVRNLIAHGYSNLDPARFWGDLPRGLDSLDRFVAAIATRLEP